MSAEKKTIFLEAGREIWQGPAPDCDIFTLKEPRIADILEIGNGIMKVEFDSKGADGKPTRATFFIPTPPDNTIQD